MSGNNEPNAAQATAAALQRAAQALSETAVELLQETSEVMVPPPLVGRVLEAVCMLRGQQADWATARRLMGETENEGFSEQVAVDFLASVENFDVAAVENDLIQQVRELTEQQGFSVEAAGACGIVAGRLCAWVVAVVRYHEANCAGVGG